MQRTFIALALSTVLSVSAHAQSAASETQRDATQQERIEQGLQSGQLSTREAGSLERDQQRIDRTQARDMRDGSLSPQEKARIQHEQNQASRDIYRDKHNAVHGNPNSASSQRLQADVQRNANQQQRVANGVKSGQLTNQEASHLEAGQKRESRNEANAAANGHVGPREQAHIQGRENHQSERINDKNTTKKPGRARTAADFRDIDDDRRLRAPVFLCVSSCAILPGLRRRACASDRRYEEVMGQTSEVKVPDIGNYTNVPVIEVLVKAGDTVTKDQGLVTLESDKATMEVPAPFDGVVKEIKVKVGDEISEGAIVALIEAAGAAAAKSAEPAKTETSAAKATSPLPPAGEVGAQSATGEGGVQKSASPTQAPPSPQPSPASGRGGKRSVLRRSRSARTRCCRTKSPTPARRCACSRANSASISAGSAPAAGARAASPRKTCRISSSRALAGASARGAGGGRGLNLLPWPQVDFSKFGEVETRPLSKIKKISGANLARNWVMIPHVTQHDDADVTELEALRVALNKENEGAGIKFTMLGFLIKAVVAALKKYPDFNASLDASGENLVLKKYFTSAFAADTPNGLVVPVLRDADKKGIVQITQETGALAAKAREGKLGPAEMSGGCFSISSLGGIGGTAFTPIVNAPEVAILGVSKSAIKPVWDGKAFQPRLILPLSLSYDHRVIDGASAARFTAYLAQLLADMRRSLL